MNILDVEQHTGPWFEARRGCVTASRVAAIRDKKVGKGELAQRRHLRFQLLAEIVREETTEHYVSPAMDWGIQQEGNAKKEYSFRRRVEVENIGFVEHPTMKRCGASPDGWVQPDGLLEIKCPNTDTHLEYLDGGVVPELYLPQLHWQMACAGPEIQWVDFVSYDPRISEPIQMFICRLERDEKVIAEMEANVEQFLVELNGMAERMLANATYVTREEKLVESIRRAKGYPYSDAALMEQLRDEGIQVP